MVHFIIQRIVLWFIVVIILIQPSMTVFAQQSNTQTEQRCVACSVTPQQMQYHITFIEDVLAQIQTIAPSGRLIGRPQVWWFQWGLFEAQEKPQWLWWMFSNFIQNLNQKVQTAWVLWMLTVAFPLDFLRDGWLSFVILTRSSPLVRDFKKLMDIDTAISDKIFAIAQGWWYYKTIDPQTLTRINQIFQKNVTNQMFMPSYTISSSVRYGEMTRFLSRINRKMKYFLALKTPTSLRGERSTKNISVTYNPVFEQQLTERYQCTRWFGQCNQSFKNFSSNIKNVVNTFANIHKDGWPLQKFSDAALKMKMALSVPTRAGNQNPQKKAQKQRVAEQLNELKRDNLIRQYGFPVEPNKIPWDWLGAAMLRRFNINAAFHFDEKSKVINSSSIAQSLQSQSAAPQDIAQKLDQDASQISDAEKKSEQNPIEINATIFQNNEKHLFTNLLTQTINNVRAIPVFSPLNQELISPIPITMQFPLVSRAIADVLVYIGNKDDKKSIISTLGQACQNQCQNVPWACYR